MGGQAVEAQGQEQPGVRPGASARSLPSPPAQAESERPQEVGVGREQRRAAPSRRAPQRASWRSTTARQARARAQDEPEARRAARSAAATHSAGGHAPVAARSATCSRYFRANSTACSDRVGREQGEGHEERPRRGRERQVAAGAAISEVEAEGQRATSTLSMRTRSERPSAAPARAPKAGLSRLLEAREGQEGEEEQELRDGLRDRVAREPDLHHVRGEEQRAEEGRGVARAAGGRRRRPRACPSTPNTTGVASAPFTPMAWKR